MNAALAFACRDSYSKWWFISYEIEGILEYGIHLISAGIEERHLPTEFGWVFLHETICSLNHMKLKTIKLTYITLQLCLSLHSSS